MLEIVKRVISLVVFILQHEKKFLENFLVDTKFVNESSEMEHSPGNPYLLLDSGDFIVWEIPRS